MCYLEDVFHGQCGHWSEEARVYHRCAAAGTQPLCFNKKTCGSLNEDSLYVIFFEAEESTDKDAGRSIRFLIQSHGFPNVDKIVSKDSADRHEWSIVRASVDKSEIKTYALSRPIGSMEADTSRFVPKTMAMFVRYDRQETKVAELWEEAERTRGDE
ncbi:hypothetical protein B0A52_07233 [Exophiala mesophila]|uniref:Uncharacterized protein n=1 Tax=Exophiala mesophila TaxID=212818 RepID=A0A438N0M8_EXOME|nr:hypothetical protein B0A52_07233 [Exophiala mesophila]